VLVIAAEKSLCSPAEIEQSIGEKYPDLSAKAEYFLPSQGFSENAIIKSAEIVFVNFGAPDQERFISQNRAKFPRAKILVGVGGTFDFLTGKIRRAPRIFRFFGLEWLWRLSQEPKRIKRIWKAVVVFSMVATFKDK
ncbi:MAG TPA: WecB/TagA/CpsF family glycosyltransferase, partial [Candidatus Bathyarchaeia archaeon]|nr:WecB/TagA/CpsF family glycosyltransferase [Candidatus Bathyarchaeia archaeon]